MPHVTGETEYVEFKKFAGGVVESENVTDVEFSTEGIAFGSTNGNVYGRQYENSFRDIDAGPLEIGEPINDGQFSKDEIAEWGITTHESGLAVIFDRINQVSEFTDTMPDDYTEGASWSWGHEYVAYGAFDSGFLTGSDSLIIRDEGTWDLNEQLAVDARVQAVAFTGDDDFLCHTEGENLVVRDVPSWDEVQLIDDANDLLTGISADGEANYVYTADEGGVLRQYEKGDSSLTVIEQVEVTEDFAALNDVQVDKAGERGVVSTQNGDLFTFVVDNLPDLEQEINVSDEPLHGCSIVNNGEWVTTGSEDGFAYVYFRGVPESGIVERSPGVGQEGATVNAFLHDVKMHVNQTETDTDGNYEILLPPREDVHLTVEYEEDGEIFNDFSYPLTDKTL